MTIPTIVEDVTVGPSFAVQVGGALTNATVSIDGIVELITKEAITAIVECVAVSTTVAVQVGFARVFSYFKALTLAAVSIDGKADEFLAGLTIMAMVENVAVAPTFAVRVGVTRNRLVKLSLLCRWWWFRSIQTMSKDGWV